MNAVSVKIKIFAGGIAPRKMSMGAVGYDLFARLESPIALQPGMRAAIPAGFAMEVPEGYEAQIRPRSGLALNHGLTVLNSPGTIDPDYRGEVTVILANLGDKPMTISHGDRIAQMVIATAIQSVIEPVEQLSSSDRDAGGFGSTGK